MRLKHIAGRLIDELVYPLVPKPYRLAFQYSKYVMFWGGMEPEIRHIKDYARRGVALDVGANIGLWSYAMKKSGLFNRVIAFEPNPTLTDDLQNSRLEGVSLISKAVSNEARTMRLRIPRQGNGALLTGWASLESRIDLDIDEFQEMDVETIRLDDLGLVDVGFVKIDVEGHELSVLEGAHGLFSESRPVCIIECRDRNRHAVENFFSDLHVGYRVVDTKAEYGFDLSPLTPGDMLFST